MLVLPIISMDKPSLPKGTRDFGPAQMAKRQFILNTIRKVFEKYGFQPLETPAMENLSTLTGKYGEEGDQLLFRVFDSGAPLEKVPDYIEERHKFMRGLQMALKNLCDLIFREFEDRDTRNWGLIKDLIESDKIDLIFLGIHLDEPQRSLLKSFLQRESVVTSINLVDFFIKASIYKNLEYPEKINHHFSQFIDNKLIKGYSKILEQYLIDNLRPRLEEFTLRKLSSKEFTSYLSEKGLRYDLTVPFARYVVMNRHEITFPFKRYQIQPVWRADRPQKGRYREFYQCDTDVIGTDSLICEAEIILMIKEVFKDLGILDYSIKISHRGILSGLADIAEMENDRSLFIAIDKLDKIGEEKVKEELRREGATEDGLTSLFKILSIKGSTQEKIKIFSNRFTTFTNGQKGISDLKEALSLVAGYGVDDQHIEFDLSLARGLSYYTGCIFEAKINGIAIGSVGGGGRYDNLTGGFGMPGVSGVGFSFGVDRLCDAMEELQLFSAETMISSKVLICHLDEECQRFALKIVQQLREKGIASEVYPDLSKLKKQLEYADRKKVPFTIVIGSDEMKSGALTFKNMKTGEQHQISLDEIISKF